MFPLKTSIFPATAADLGRHLNDSLRELFALTHDPVEVRDKSYPHLDSLTACLDGAQLPERPPPMPSSTGEQRPALTIDSLALNASPLVVGPAPVQFKLAAKDVELRRANDRDENILLLVHDASDGHIEISLAISDLEALIAEVARTEAGKHGVNIEGVELSLRSRSPRSLAADVRLRAKKMFFTASLGVTGQLDLDEQLNARISGLDCTGEGAIASVACGVLKPHLQKLDGREFPLMSLPLGEVRLHDVRIALDDKLSVTAEFGSARE
ncbi:MAG TPA: hypothetical protein VE086_03695 [Chthoniobacterales bacterium]|nr:hypothetical protein [Chthoniobacterales bacterium]